jgi:hypothetical protein
MLGIEPAAANIARKKALLRSVAAMAVAALTWIGTIGIGVRQVYSFETTPGDRGSTPMAWPKDSIINPTQGQPLLLMVVHPQCSCSAASLSELSQIMSKSQGRLDARVLFEERGDLLDTSTWEQARRIPGLIVGLDLHGVEATRFGMLTSGHVVLYDASGRLRFSGGITAARGHEGENVGRDQVLNAINSTSDLAAVHAVFGCSIN